MRHLKGTLFFMPLYIQAKYLECIMFTFCPMENLKELSNSVVSLDLSSSRDHQRHLHNNRNCE